MPQTTIRVFRAAAGDVPIQDWLDELEDDNPRVHAKCLQRILALSQLGSELRRPLADILRDGVHELRAKVGRVNYRMLYFFCGANVACLSHGFTKEGKVPENEIDVAVQRKRLVESNEEKFTADWEL